MATVSSPASIVTKLDTDAIKRALSNLDLVMSEVPIRTITRAAKRVSIPLRNAEKLAIHDRTGALRKSLGVRIKSYTGVATQGFAGAGPSISSAQSMTGGKAVLSVHAIIGPRRIKFVPTGKENHVKRTSRKTQSGYIMPSKYAHLVEFGHKNRYGDSRRANGGLVRTPPHPFIRKAMQGLNVGGIIADYAYEIKRGIDACDWNHSRCALPKPKTDIQFV